MTQVSKAILTLFTCNLILFANKVLSQDYSVIERAPLNANYKHPLQWKYADIFYARIYNYSKADFFYYYLGLFDFDNSNEIRKAKQIQDVKRDAEISLTSFKDDSVYTYDYNASLGEYNLQTETFPIYSSSFYGSNFGKRLLTETIFFDDFHNANITGVWPKSDMQTLPATVNTPYINGLRMSPINAEKLIDRFKVRRTVYCRMQFVLLPIKDQYFQYQGPYAMHLTVAAPKDDSREYPFPIGVYEKGNILGWAIAINVFADEQRTVSLGKVDFKIPSIDSYDNVTLAQYLKANDCDAVFPGGNKHLFKMIKKYGRDVETSFEVEIDENGKCLNVIPKNKSINLQYDDNYGIDRLKKFRSAILDKVIWWPAKNWRGDKVSSKLLLYYSPDMNIKIEQSYPGLSN
jgi:hypothetical protein